MRVIRPVTPGGWLAIMLAAVLAAIAVRALNPWLLLVACALVVPVLLSQVFRPDLNAVSVGFRSPQRMVVGETVEQILTVRNGGHRSTPGLGVVHTCGGMPPAVISVPPLPPGTEASFTIERVPTRRSVTADHDVRLWTTAPFGMVGHTRRVHQPARIHIYPARAQPLTQETFRPGTEPHGLREWRHGDDSRHVNWRATARRDALIVIVPEPEEETRLVLLVAGSAQHEDWEALLSTAAWTAAAAAGPLTTVTLLARGVEPWSGNEADGILEWFAALGEVGEPDPTLLRLARQAAEPDGIVLVAGSDPFGLLPLSEISAGSIPRPAPGAPPAAAGSAAPGPSARTTPQQGTAGV